MEISSITAALTGIKTAIEITKLIDSSSQSLENAELKFKLSEILISLADTNIEIVNIRTLLEEKVREIDELESKLKLIDTVVKKDDAYYRKTENGYPIGEPFCLKCWEVDKELYHLIGSCDDITTNQCPKCNSKYNKLKSHDQKGESCTY